VFEAGNAGDGTMFYSQTSHLKFQVDPQFFRDGSIIVDCKASFPRTQIVLKDTLQSNIKAGLGLRQYAADTLSGANLDKPNARFDLVLAILAMTVVRYFLCGVLYYWNEL
jgi:hypothetical protein